MHQLVLALSLLYSFAANGDILGPCSIMETLTIDDLSGLDSKLRVVQTDIFLVPMNAGQTLSDKITVYTDDYLPINPL